MCMYNVIIFKSDASPFCLHFVCLVLLHVLPLSGRLSDRQHAVRQVFPKSQVNAILHCVQSNMLPGPVDVACRLSC